MWPFRKHQEAKEVKEAREKRDVALDRLDGAINEVDRVHDRIIADYEEAEADRLERLP